MTQPVVVSPGAGLADSPVAITEICDLALIDLDGVAYRGHEPIEHAAEGIAALRDRDVTTVFVTNNASREPEEIAAQLSSLRIPTRPNEVLTAAQACARYLGEFVEPGAKVLVVGGAGLLTAVREAGYEIVTSADDGPAAVAQGFSPDLGWKDLAEAAYAVAAGAVHVASNRDLSLPTARGFAPGNGTLVQAVSSATGIEPVSAGKPSPTMYHMAVAATGSQRTLVIGDRLDTDLAGARGGGYLGLLVLTGVSTARDAILAPPSLRPHLIVADLSGLEEAHGAPTSDEDGRWHCQDRSAAVIDGKLQLSVTPVQGGMALVRAAAAAVWAARDNGIEVDEGSVPEFPVGRIAQSG
ncbi:Haloacid Dehalogenase Superfamily Class (subfamily) IIA [Micrococcales bacterium KH10]|nr:Haloacid Dehalogenase Superfamily Class (subfamily) IIA [Micrococcales bacterium KH10]